MSSVIGAAPGCSTARTALTSLRRNTRMGEPVALPPFWLRPSPYRKRCT